MRNPYHDIGNYRFAFWVSASGPTDPRLALFKLLRLNVPLDKERIWMMQYCYDYVAFPVRNSVYSRVSCHTEDVLTVLCPKWIERLLPRPGRVTILQPEPLNPLPGYVGYWPLPPEDAMTAGTSC